MNKTKSFIIALFITLIFFILLSFFSKNQNNLEQVIISRVIDGDTLELKDGRIARLANINSPEKNTPYSELSYNFLKNFENKIINISILGNDKYGRLLIRAYSPDYLNLKIVEEGLASTFLVNEFETKKFKEAEKRAIVLEKGIWQHSKYYNCLKTKIYPKKESVYFQNLCNISLKGFTIKDESRKQFKFSLNPSQNFQLYTFSGNSNSTNLFWNLNSEVWNNDRDTLYIYDEEGKIVHFDSYGY